MFIRFFYLISILIISIFSSALAEEKKLPEILQNDPVWENMGQIQGDKLSALVSNRTLTLRDLRTGKEDKVYYPTNGAGYKVTERGATNTSWELTDGEAIMESNSDGKTISIWLIRKEKIIYFCEIGKDCHTIIVKSEKGNKIH